MLLFFSLCCIYNLSLVRNVCKAVPTSLFQPHNGFNELLEMHSKFPFNLLVNWQWLFKQANHGAYIRILVYRWRLRTRILALARRWTLTQALVMCVTGYPTPQLFQNSTQQLCIPKLKHLNAQEKFLYCTLLYTTCVFTALYYLSVTEEVDTTVAQYLSCHCTKRVPWTNAFC